MAILVPKIFHRIWLGNPMPEQFERWGETWLRHHPGWTMKLWTEKNLPPSQYPELIEKCRYYSARANLYRLEILLREGGVYVDTDFECRKNIEPLIDERKAFAAYQLHESNQVGAVNNAFIGAVPNQSFVQEALDRFPDYFDPELSIRCGPWLLTDVVRRHPEVTVFPKMYFHPFGWEEKPGRPEDYPEAYAIHYWSKMWLPQSKEKIPR